MVIQRVMFVVSLCAFTACSDTDRRAEATHDTHVMNSEMNRQAESTHDTHVMNMEPSGEAVFTDGSLYQVASTWTTQDAGAISLGDLKGRYIVMAMTYTSCEFSCPLIVADMRKIINEVPESERHRVNLVLFSIDPARDTPEVMKAFAMKNGLATDQWTLLRGEADDVMEMAALIGVRYKKMPDGEYSHSNIITLLNAEGEIVHQQNGLGSDLTSASSRALLAILSEEA